MEFFLQHDNACSLIGPSIALARLIRVLHERDARSCASAKGMTTDSGILALRQRAQKAVRVRTRQLPRTGIQRHKVVVRRLHSQEATSGRSMTAGSKSRHRADRIRDDQTVSDVIKETPSGNEAAQRRGEWTGRIVRLGACRLQQVVWWH
eukprot:gnl/TRDRNA2_/TRDRNA2_51313_c0_seq1.p2 gnl/TRDRNA2_/TRDRNA2_51313_c0~~gnl/TRDRNA2_/TRDRNA2_51313_c0_seq1.p2  ORF type:complete len:150 (-),score=16.04 gnl/TRDRNA2_/TRDRNA2_51313_c0_seq1:32-481(-)